MFNGARAHAAFAWFVAALIYTLSALLHEAPWNIAAAAAAVGAYYMWRRFERGA